MMYFYNPPKILQKMIKKIQWNSKCQKILITFDDCPNESSTIKILDKLDKYEIKTVFFCNSFCEDEKPLIKEIISRGHTIGNHGFSHKSLFLKSSQQINKEIQSLNELFLSEFKIQLKYFRPPYGRITPGLTKILHQKKMKNIMWSLFTYDYKNNINIIKFGIAKYLKENSIVVFHDNKKSSIIILDALDYLYEYVAKNNLIIGNPYECLK